MKVSIVVFLVFFFLCSFFTAGYSQEEGELYIISEKVGEEIDAGEREKYDLFPDMSGFQSAKFFALPDSSYIIQINYIDDSDGSAKELRIKRPRVAIMIYKNKIEGRITQTEAPQSSSALSPTDTLYTVELKDGNTLQGTIIHRDEESITIRTPAGIEIKAPKRTIVSIKQMRGKMVGEEFFRVDPNYSRLLFAPTGRPLRKGEGYFTDYYVFFPGVAYGFTDNFSLMAGFSLLPGLSLDEQLMYVAPRIGKQFTDKFSLSAGALYLSVVDEFAAGIAFGSATYGEPDKSFTIGLGLGYTKEEGEDFQFADHPILMLGGNVRLSNSAAFVTENWFITGEGLKLSQQPFSFAIRLFGERITVDLGMIVVMEILDEGFPIPWLSFAYYFGK